MRKYNSAKEKVLDNISSLEEIFAKEFKQCLKKTYNNGKKMLEYFYEEELLNNIPVDYVLKDNIKNNSTIIKNIINKTDNNNYNVLCEKSNKISIDKNYYSIFLLSYDTTVYSANVNISRRNKGKFNHKLNYYHNMTLANVKENNAIIDLNKLGIVSKINISTALPYSENIKIKQNKKNATNLYKEIRQHIMVYAKKTNNFKEISNINIYNLDIKHILLPVYNIRFHKPGLDVKYLINGQSGEIKKK